MTWNIFIAAYDKRMIDPNVKINSLPRRESTLIEQWIIREKSRHVFFTFHDRLLRFQCNSIPAERFSDADAFRVGYVRVSFSYSRLR